MSDFLIDEETDLLAAEFVLGSLDPEERASAYGLLKTDHAFIAMVRIWERRFGELHLMVEPVEPDPTILRRIKAKVLSLSAAPAAAANPPSIKPATEPAAATPPAAAPAVEPAAAPPAGGQMPKAANLELRPLQAVAEETAASLEAIAKSETVPPAPVAEVTTAVVPAAVGEETPAEVAPPAGAAPTSGPVAATPPAAEFSVAAPPEAAPPAATPPDAQTPAMFPPPVTTTSAPEALNPADIRPAAELRPPEIKIERETAAKAAISQAPPLTAPRRPERFPERAQGRSAAGPEITIDVIRSRGRWRALGIVMSLLVFALAGLLAAWRFAPDRLPLRLRPAQFMTAIGVDGVEGPPEPRPEVPAAKPPPPTGQFDE